MTNFEFEDDRAFFEALLGHEGEAISAYAELFDSRPPEVKRREFAAMRNRTLAERLAEAGADGGPCILKLIVSHGELAKVKLLNYR